MRRLGTFLFLFFFFLVLRQGGLELLTLLPSPLECWDIGVHYRAWLEPKPSTPHCVPSQACGWAGTLLSSLDPLCPTQGPHPPDTCQCRQKRTCPTPALSPVPPTLDLPRDRRLWAGRGGTGAGLGTLSTTHCPMHLPLPPAQCWALGPWLTTRPWDKPHKTEPH